MISHIPVFPSTHLSFPVTACGGTSETKTCGIWNGYHLAYRFLLHPYNYPSTRIWNLNIIKAVCELSLWSLKMDLLFVNVLVSLLSAVVMMTGIVYILTYILGSFSSKSGSMSLRVVLYSLSYFFGSTIFLFMGVEWLTDVASARAQGGQSFYLNIGASALALAALLNLICGILTVFLYLRGQTSLSLTLQRASNGIRTRLKSRQHKTSKKRES